MDCRTGALDASFCEARWRRGFESLRGGVQRDAVRRIARQRACGRVGLHSGDGSNDGDGTTAAAANQQFAAVRLCRIIGLQ